MAEEGPKRAFKSAPGAPQEPQDSPKETQEGPRRPKRVVVWGSRNPQDGPKGPKAGPGGPKDGLREAQQGLVRNHVPGRLSGKMAQGSQGAQEGPRTAPKGP
eukprot:2590331-Pyramimonas_sp.AAC.1